MKTYIRKPAQYKAIQWDGTKEMALKLKEEIPNLELYYEGEFGLVSLHIHSRSEIHCIVSPNDYIMINESKRYYSIDKKTFEELYEEVK